MQLKLDLEGRIDYEQNKSARQKSFIPQLKMKCRAKHINFREIKLVLKIIS